MNEPKTKPMEELQIVEDPNYEPPPEIEGPIYDPYVETNEKANNSDTVTPRKLTRSQIICSSITTTILIVLFVGFFVHMAYETGTWQYALIPILAPFGAIAGVLLLWFSYSAQKHFHSESVKEGILKAEREKNKTQH